MLIKNYRMVQKKKLRQQNFINKFTFILITSNEPEIHGSVESENWSTSSEIHSMVTVFDW